MPAPRQAWGESNVESRSIDATSVYKLLFPQAASAGAEAESRAGQADENGEVDMYSLLFTKALPGSVSTALSAAHTQLAGSSAAQPKSTPGRSPKKAPASELLRVLQQEPTNLLSSSSVHGGSFSGLRGFKQAKQGLQQANSARRSTPASSAHSPSRSRQDDFITRSERAKREQAIAEADAAAEQERKAKAQEEAAARQREREEAAQRRLREEAAQRREDERKLSEKRGARAPHAPRPPPPRPARAPTRAEPHAAPHPRRARHRTHTACVPHACRPLGPSVAAADEALRAALKEQQRARARALAARRQAEEQAARERREEQAARERREVAARQAEWRACAHRPCPERSPARSGP